jgi:hypothetical protein
MVNCEIALVVLEGRVVLRMASFNTTGQHAIVDH